MADALNAITTTLKAGDGGGPETFTAIAKVLDMQGPGLSADTDETTAHDSPGGWGEQIPTILRTGEVTFDLLFLVTNATQNASTGLIADLANRTKRNYQIVWPDAGNTVWEFAAYVTGFQPSAPVAGALRASVTLSGTGQPTLN